MTCIYLERNPDQSSLSSWITTAMDGVYAAIAEGVTAHVSWPRHRCPEPYIDAEAFVRCPNMFEWYFRQPLCRSRHRAGETIWKHGDEIIHRHPIVNIEAVYRKYLAFNTDVLNRFDALLERYSLRPDSTIAISWRGTDLFNDRPRTPIDQYFPVIDEILAAEPNLTIFAKPEERGAAEALVERYPETIIPDEFFIAETGEKRMQDLVSTASGYERGMQVALMILFFSKCKYLLRNDANLSLVAGWLSDSTVIHISDNRVQSFP